MKKRIALCLLVALCLGLCGCGMNIFNKPQEANRYPIPDYEYEGEVDTTIIWNGDSGMVYVPQITEPAYTVPVYTQPPAQTLTTLEYWIEYCDKRMLSEQDLYGMSQEECRLARNAIYAKSGRIFQSADLSNFFSRYSWYYPSVSPSNFTDSMMNSYQLYNLNLVIEYEERWD